MIERSCRSGRAFQGFLVACSCLLALGLLALGGGQTPPRAAAAAAHCSVAQKQPLYVGFAPGMSLDGFEAAAIASREIWHDVKAWLCETPSDDVAELMPHSLTLHGALVGRHGLRLEQIQFDHPSLTRAHVELRDLATSTQAPRGWRIHLARASDAQDAWHVTRQADQRFEPEKATLAR